jgi:hypothetical protein
MENKNDRENIVSYVASPARPYYPQLPHLSLSLIIDDPNQKISRSRVPHQ